MRVFLATVERKVKAALLGTFAASLLAAIINALLNGSPIPQTPHAWAQFVLITIGPSVAAGLSGYAARHESRPPVDLPKTTP